MSSTNTGPDSNEGEVHLIVSDESDPAIPMKAGKKWRVTSVSVVSPTLEKSDKVAARLCGGTSTCVALIEI